MKSKVLASITVVMLMLSTALMIPTQWQRSTLATN